MSNSKAQTQPTNENHHIHDLEQAFPYLEKKNG